MKRVIPIPLIGRVFFLLGLILVSLVSTVFAEKSPLKDITQLPIMLVKHEQQPFFPPLQHETLSYRLKGNVFFTRVQGYDAINMTHAYYAYAPSMPDIPRRTLEMKIPKDSVIVNISVKEGSYREIQNINLIPVQEENQSQKRVSHNEIYTSDALFPYEFISYDIHFKGDEKIVMIRIPAALYQPKEKKILLIEYMKLDVAFAQPAREEVKEQNVESTTFETASEINLASIGLSSTPPIVEWNKTYGGIVADGGYAVQQISDGGYIVAGYTDSFGAGSRDIYVIKTDSYGNKQWERTFGGVRFDEALSVQRTSEGGYIITGNTYSFGTGANSDIYLIKTDSNGNKQWEKIFGTNKTEKGYDIKNTPDGGYIILGGKEEIFSFPGRATETHSLLYLIKTDLNGNKQWERTYPGITSSGVKGSAVLQTTDGGYLAPGLVPENVYTTTRSNFYIAKANASGGLQWNKIIDVNNNIDWGIKVAQRMSDGGYLLLGNTKNWNIFSGFSGIVIKTDANGNMLWNRVLPWIANDLQPTKDRGYIVAGGISDSSISYSSHVGPLYLAKLNTSGGTQWEITQNESPQYPGFSMSAFAGMQTIDEGYIITGIQYGYNYSQKNIILYKFTPERPASCSNGIKDSDETDIDCGGTTCNLCADTKKCLSRYDCRSNFCNALSLCGCIDRDRDSAQDMKCGGADCNDNNASTIQCPVLLVHGIASDPSVWNRYTDFNFSHVLQQDGFQVFLSDYSPGIGLCDAMGNIPTYAGVLEDEINTITTTTGAAQVDVVAHSMGGLITRQYTRFGYNNTIRNFIMLGTPNHGSFLPPKRDRAQQIAGNKTLGIRQECTLSTTRAIIQQTPGSTFLNILNYGNPETSYGKDYIEPSIHHATLGGNKSTWISELLFPLSTKGEDDGVVKLQSLRLNNSPIYFQKYPLSHFYLYRNEILYTTVKGLLRGTIPYTSSATVPLEAAVLPPENTPLEFQDAFYIEETIATGMTHIYNISLTETRIAVFTLGWLESSSDLDVSLRTPSGMLIHSTRPDLNLTYYPSNISAEETIEGFISNNPEKGQWQLIITAKSGPDAAYVAFARVSSELQLTLTSDKANYLLQSPMQFVINFTFANNPITTSVLNATLIKPDGSTLPLTLYNDGTNGDTQANDSSYSAQYTDTSSTGVYELKVRASTLLDDQSHYRESSLQTQVYTLTDLSLTSADISFTPKIPIEEESTVITAVIHNNRNISANNITIAFYNDDPNNYGKRLGTRQISVGALTTANASIVWQAERSARFIYISISPFHALIENNYSNNIAYRNITIIPQPLHLFNTSLSPGWNLISPLLVTPNPSSNNTLPVSNGWNLIGYSSQTPIAWSDVRLTNGTQTLSLSAAESLGLVQRVFYGFNASQQSYIIVPTEDTHLRPQRAYWFYVYASGWQLLFPGRGGVAPSFNWTEAHVKQGNQIKNISDGEVAGWMQATLNSFNAQTQSYTLVPGSDTHIHPWQGYMLYAQKDNLTLLT